MGRSNNSHNFFSEFLNDSPTVSQQTGYVSQEGGTGGYKEGGGWSVPGMSGTPNEFVLQPLDCCHTYLGEL